MNPKNILIGLSLITVLMTPACEPFSLKQDDLQLSADLSIFNSYFSIRYLDAATGKVIGLSGDADFAVDISSSTSNLIVNTDGEYTKSLALRFGFFTLALNPYIPVPTPENPATVTIRTRSGKYLESTTTIELTGERAITFEVLLINLSSPPSGITIETFQNVGEATSTGEVSGAFTLSSSNKEAELEIPAGTILKDENGAPLSGVLSARIMTVDGDDTVGFEAMPGLDQPLITNQGTQSLMTEPVGYQNVKIQDANGKIAASVTGREVSVVTKLMSDSESETGVPVKAGDIIPSYGFDRATGTWNYRGSGEVLESEGGLVIRKIISPLKGRDENFLQDLVFTFRSSLPKKMRIDWTSATNLEETNFRLTVVRDGANNKKKKEKERFRSTLTGNQGTIWVNGLTDNPILQERVRIRLRQTNYKSRFYGKSLVNAQQQGDDYFWAVNFDFPDQEEAETSFPVNLKLNLCDGIVLDGASIPDFSAIMLWPGFEDEEVFDVTGGIIILPGDPSKFIEPWPAKIIYNNDKEYPQGDERSWIVAVMFRDEESDSGTKYYFDWTVTDPAECAELKRILGI
jgi:hypothetical protein